MRDLLLACALSALACTANPDVQTLASGEGPVFGLVTTVDAAVWISSGRVRSVPLSGGHAQTLVEADATSIALSGADLFFAVSTGEISHRSPDGATTLLASVGSTPHSMIADEESVFVAAGRDTTVVSRVPRAGGPAVELVTLLHAPGPYADHVPLGRLIADQDSVYYAHDEIVRIPKDGSGALVLADFADVEDAALAQDSSHVYWSRRPDLGDTNPALMRVAKNGAAPERVLHQGGTSSGKFVGLTSGAGGLYWLRGYSCDYLTLFNLPDPNSSPVLLLSYFEEASDEESVKLDAEVAVANHEVVMADPCVGKILRFDP